MKIGGRNRKAVKFLIVMRKKMIFDFLNINICYCGRGESHWINKLSYNNDLTAHGGLPP